jgi:hypothetical protein
MLLLSEGPYDIGTRASRADHEQRQGAVRVLVRRILEEHWNRGGIAAAEIDADVLARVHKHSSDVSGYERKVHLAIVEAGLRNCTCVAVVVDRDGERNQARLSALCAGRDEAEKKGEALAQHTATGLAVETVEAWLLADEQALTRALNLNPPQQQLPAPEELDGAPGSDRHPKSVFLAIVDRSDLAPSVAYDAVAEHARIDHLERRCPLGFARFAAELRTRCI